MRKISFVRNSQYFLRISELQLSQFYLATCHNHLGLTANSSFSPGFRLENETTVKGMPMEGGVGGGGWGGEVISVRKVSPNACYLKLHANFGMLRTSLPYSADEAS